LIAAEDTRHTGKLLKHFEIETPLTSYFEHNKLNKLDFILEKLSTGMWRWSRMRGLPPSMTPAMNWWKPPSLRAST
jgi:16S rRNA C1402 (ribose-2'-O) methylase RsmI